MKTDIERAAQVVEAFKKLMPEQSKALDTIAVAVRALASPPAPAEGEREAALEEAAKRAEAEEELNGPMPEAVAYAVQRDPINALRGAVRATKKGIAAGIRSLKGQPTPAAPADQSKETDRE